MAAANWRGSGSGGDRRGQGVEGTAGTVCAQLKLSGAALAHTRTQRYFVVTKEGDLCYPPLLCCRILLATFYIISHFLPLHLPSVTPFYKSYSVMTVRLL